VKIVLDTNVFVSGFFFGGHPNQILRARRQGQIELLISPEILEEYRSVAEILTKEHPGIVLKPLLDFIASNAEIIQPSPLPMPVCEDPDDDKFLACALSGKIKGYCEWG
jgi:putative PIN family toxin of toxin-antitoxin system